jgi:toxin CcdB
MNRQFDVFPNPIRAGRDTRPYVVSLQHGNLDTLRTRLIAPLGLQKAVKSEGRLTPKVTVLDVQLYLLPMEIVTIPVQFLREPVANLEDLRRQIIDAVDLMLVGF